MLVDSHCHLDQLDLTKYAGELANALTYANEQGVKHFLSVGTTLNELPALLQLADAFPNVSVSVGLHPNEIETHEPDVEELVKLGEHAKVIAIGETGLDYFRSNGDLEWQRERFRCHIRAAKKLNKPLIIHTRQARADTLRILKEENAASVAGVMHCFTEDWDTAQQALDLGFVISFSGIVTFQNAKDIQEVVKKIPLDRLLVETDSPYLAPVPHRGTPNEPAYVRYVAEYIAKLRGITFEELAEQTTRTFGEIFKVNLGF